MSARDRNEIRLDRCAIDLCGVFSISMDSFDYLFFVLSYLLAVKENIDKSIKCELLTSIINNLVNFCADRIRKTKKNQLE